MENPYRDYSQPGPTQDSAQPQLRSRLVRQVQVVAILLIVQGALEIVMGLLTGCTGGLFPVMMNAASEAGEAAPYDASFGTVAAVFYLVIAVLHFAAAGLHLAAGIRALRFRGRRLGMAAMIVGLITAPMMFCLPTALGLAIYGLIVFVNEAVVEAFKLGERRMKVDDILAACG
jgi:hypothetical protein